MAHQLIATIAQPTIATAEASLRALAPEVDLAEIRLDVLWRGPPDVDTATATFERLLAAASAPLLATLRPERQGGMYAGPEDVRVNMLEAALRVGFHAIDLENDLQVMAPLVQHLRKTEGKILLSNHLDATPNGEQALRHLTAMQDLAGDLHKLAFPAGNVPAFLRALELAHVHHRRTGRPAISPDLGASERALLALAGNHATYGHADDSPAATPAQPSISQLQAVWNHWGIAKTELPPYTNAPTSKDGAAHSQWLAVIGADTHASLSPRMNNAALQASKHVQRFGAMSIPAAPGLLRLLIGVGHRLGLLGASVTNPHKMELARVAKPDAIAKKIGAANVLWYQNGEPQCANTDYLAIVELVSQYEASRGKLAPAPGDLRSALILGSGGAARAAAHALHDLGFKILVSGRNSSTAQSVAASVGPATDVLPWADALQMSPTVVVQATSSATPKWNGQCSLGIEFVYQDSLTTFEAALHRAGTSAISGRQILARQAVHAWKYWQLGTPDISLMESAIQMTYNQTTEAIAP